MICGTEFVDGYVWLCMYGYVWLCMAMYGYVCMAMNVPLCMYGYVWLCMAMYGYVWLSMHVIGTYEVPTDWSKRIRLIKEVERIYFFKTVCLRTVRWIERARETLQLIPCVPFYDL